MSYISGESKRPKSRKREDINSFLISEYESFEISKPNIFLYTCLFLPLSIALRYLPFLAHYYNMNAFLTQEKIDFLVYFFLCNHKYLFYYFFVLFL